MDFALDDTAQQVAELAATVLRDVGEHARVTQSLAGAAGYDETAWKALAQAGLLALAVPSEHGGDGLGAVEVATVLTAVGRQAVSLPAFATLALGVLPLPASALPQHLTAWRTAAVFTAALEAFTLSDDRIDGRARAVPFAAQAHRMLLATDAGIALVPPDAEGVTLTRTTTSTGSPEYTVECASVRADESCPVHSPTSRSAHSPVPPRWATACSPERWT